MRNGNLQRNENCRKRKSDTAGVERSEFCGDFGREEGFERSVLGGVDFARKGKNFEFEVAVAGVVLCLDMAVVGEEEAVGLGERQFANGKNGGGGVPYEDNGLIARLLLQKRQSAACDAF